MTNLNIDRLTLKLSGISELEGKRLTDLITDRLANSDISSRSNRASPQIQINIPAQPNPNLDQLSQQIVTEILRQLN